MLINHRNILHFFIFLSHPIIINCWLVMVLQYNDTKKVTLLCMDLNFRLFICWFLFVLKRFFIIIFFIEEQTEAFMDGVLISLLLNVKGQVNRLWLREWHLFRTISIVLLYDKPAYLFRFFYSGLVAYWFCIAGIEVCHVFFLHFMYNLFDLRDLCFYQTANICRKVI